MPREIQIPNIPAADETIPGFTFSGWSAFFAPAGLPQLILKRLNAAFVAAVRSPEVAEKLKAQFLVPVGSTSEELADLIKTGIEHWSQVAAKAGLQKQ
jgi:tripartite-type tricarboxylate transporter receptor subunit TctC